MTTKYHDEVHYIAEKFLEDYAATQANAFTTETIEAKIERLVLVRDRIPEYFCGMKSGKLAVWSHDIRFAKSLTQAEAENWVEYLAKMGEFVLPIWNGVS